jgi:hypothetical protein
MLTADFDMEVIKPNRLDQLGIALSATCAVHCVITPALTLLLPLIGSAFASVWVHRAFAVVLVPLGVFAFIRGYLKSGRSRAMLCGSAGMTALLWSLIIHDHLCCPTDLPLNHIVLNTGASIVIVLGHWLNLIDVRQTCGTGYEHH